MSWQTFTLGWVCGFVCTVVGLLWWARHMDRTVQQRFEDEREAWAQSYRERGRTHGREPRE